MPQRLDQLSEVSVVDTGYLFPASEVDVSAYNISFKDVLRNMNNIRSTGTNMTIGANTDETAIFVNQTDNKVGVGSFYDSGIGVKYNFEVAGVSGDNPAIALRGTGVNQRIVYDDDIFSWSQVKDGNNNLYISGLDLDNPHMFFYSGTGGTVLTDGSAATGNLITGGVQIFGRQSVVFTVDDSVDSLGVTYNKSGFNSDKDLYINYHSGSDMNNGTYIGASGSIFVKTSDLNTRIGNIATDPDARLLVTNNRIGASYQKGMVIEDDRYPNLYFRRNGSVFDASILYDGQNNIHFTRNRDITSAASTGKFVIDTFVGKLGVGGLTPTFGIDYTGTSSQANRYRTSSDKLITKYISDYPDSSGPVESIFTTYSSGDTNVFLAGYDFENDNFFFQTGDGSDNYVAARNTHKLSKNGNFDIKRYYTTNEEFSQGRFIQSHYASSDTGAVYISMDNATHNYDTKGSVSASTLAPMSGRVIGVDLICQNNSGLLNNDAYLVFNKFKSGTVKAVGSDVYFTGTNYFQIYSPESSSYYSSPSLSSNAYVQCEIGTGVNENVFNLSARVGATDSPFTNPSNLSFDKFDYIGWTLYSMNGSTLELIDKPVTISTTIEYLVDSDMKSQNGSFINTV